MLNNTKTTRFPARLIRQFSATIPALALVLGLTGAVQAQSESEESGVLEEVIVTGTHRQGLSPTESLAPIDIISGISIGQQGAFDMTDSLTKLTPALNTQRFPIADGTAFVRPVSLRNLAPDQTLVLVNGSRRHRSALVNLQLAPLGTVNQGSQAVDFSAFPSSAIKRVEILRDGASAQYGSDAIAGVINIILKDASEGFSFNAQYGEYYESDGERVKIDANAGLPLGENGFINLSAEYVTSDITNRGKARPDAAAIADIVGKDLVAYDGFGQRWGDPDIEAIKFFVNAGIDVSENAEIYAHASYMDKDTVGGFFYRGPVVDSSFGISARTTLQTDNDGDFLPDPASQSLVDSITGAGLNPADYLTANPTSPSGWVLLNPIHTEFPGGYSPLFGASITDYAVVFGTRGDSGNNFSWDVNGRVAKNEVEYLLQDSINPSLGSLSPTTFNPGTLTQEETSLNADFVKTFDNSPLNFAFGFQWRNETYKIKEGDAGSTTVGPTFAQFGVGSDGFQGFPSETAGTFKADSIAAYVDVETDLTDQLSGAIAVRFEDPDGFGSTVDYKISARYAFTDDFALRGTFNTGFRTPTPGQVHTLNITTSADSEGNLIPLGTYPVAHPIAQALGAVPLISEESTAFTIGLVWQPLENTNVTVDYYEISIDDRIGLLGTSVDQAAVDTLNAAGYPNADLLLGSAASFFNNGFDSDITGLDLMIASDFDVSGGTLSVDFRHNYNDQKVKNIKSNTISAGRAFDLENQIPNHRSILTFNYALDRFNGLVRLNRYGGWETTGGLFGPGDGSDAASYGSNILVDVEVQFRFNETFTVAVGGENIFDTFPDREANGVLDFLGVIHSVTSPYGFNGGFWYARISTHF